MNQIDVVMDVGESLDTAEPIVSTRGGGANFVGQPGDTRVVPMIRKAKVSAFRFTESGNGVRLGVRVKNLATVPIEIDRVAFEYRFEDPDEFSAAWGRVVQEIGGGVELLPRHEARKGPLPPGEEREYSLSHLMSDRAVLVAESLAPSRFWIAAYSGSTEVGRGGGEVIRRILDPSRITVNRRASLFFQTMPDSVRLTVLETISPLRGIEVGQWPSSGAKPLEGSPRTFVSHAAEDPVLVLTPTEGEGVEIVDMIREGILEQIRKSKKSEDSKP